MPTEQWRRENVERVRASRRKWYANNRQHAMLEVKRRQSEIREWILELKGTLKCQGEGCNENHIAVLDFHHRDPSQKDMEISKAHRWGCSKERILKEMEKCIVLCSNCHRKFHWNEKYNIQ